MQHFTIGIDTGGTYTDAVIINSLSHEIIATAKAHTSKGDLSIGVSQALESVLKIAGKDFDVSKITLVSLSTTLATNALVEGHGSSVTTVLIGFDDDMMERTQIKKAVPEVNLITIDGGHKYSGEEITPFNEIQLKTALKEQSGTADAYAVASLYSVRNPKHEQLAEQIIKSETGKPVSLSCDLSDALDGPRRALTATFNARIISLIVALEDAVKKSMHALGISAQIMMVKGDGSISSSASVIEKPIETILSGPAASVIGARFLTNKKDFVISDIGGTTTDVALVHNGWPEINEQGSDVGGFRTLVRAIDMQTVGLGGDSEVDISLSGDISLKANRVVPIAYVAKRWPSTITDMKIALGESIGMQNAIRYVMFPEGASLEKSYKKLSDREKSFLKQIPKDKPILFRDVVLSPSDRSRLPKLVERGLLQISGFTPSDAAHVLGLQSQWSVEGATLACELIAKSSEKVTGQNTLDELKSFSRHIHNLVATKSTRLILERLCGQRFNDSDVLINAVADNSHKVQDLNIKLTPNVSVIAVGGPASVFYPEVGKRLGTELIIPKNSSVANAVGAAIGMIKVRVNVEVTRQEKGGYNVHCAGEPLIIEEGNDAIEKAKQLASLEAKNKAKLMGSADVDIEFSVERLDIPGLLEHASLISAVITAEVVGKPDVN